MADDTDVLLRFYEDQWTEIHHIEDQRATLTNIIILITSVIIGFVTQKGLILDSLPIVLLLIVLGLYGAVATAKYYERYRFSVSRLQHIRRRIDELHPDAQILQLKEGADAEHQKKYPRLHKLHLNRLWITLHLAIGLLGIVLAIIILIRIL